MRESARLSFLKMRCFCAYLSTVIAIIYNAEGTVQNGVSKAGKLTFLRETFFLDPMLKSLQRHLEFGHRFENGCFATDLRTCLARTECRQSPGS